MKISVVTIAYNAAATIAATIRSVLMQDYDNVEYIVVDGASTDATLDVVKSFGDAIHKMISEPDEGVYHAMNKGIAVASGEAIALLNADDVYAHANVLTQVALQLLNYDTCYGDLEYVDRNLPEKVRRRWKSGTYQRKGFERGWMPPHPAFFARKALYEKFGSFDTRLRTSADYELMLRYLYRYGASATYIPDVLVQMKTGGQSNSSIKNRIAANREDRLAWKLNGLRARPLTIWLKPFRKLGQFMSR